MAALWERAVALALVLFGLIVSYAAGDYGIGSLSDMAPGYFPRLLGFLLTIVGLFNLVAGWQSDADELDISWRSFVFIFGGLLAWTLLVERLGLIPASFVLIAFTSLARPPVNPVQLVTTTVVSSLLAALIFIAGFGLPLRMFVW